MRKSICFVASGLVAGVFFLANPGAESMKEDKVPGENFDRAQTLVVNLNRVKDSSGYFLLEGIGFTKTMDHNLTKALRQVEEVDKTYGNLRNRPDSRHLEETRIKIDRAIQANNQLNSDLKEAYIELKTQITETLAIDEEIKKHPK